MSLPPRRALRQTRRTLEPLLPLDTLSTHYPDVDGTILLNVAFAPAEYASLEHAPAHAGQPLADYVRDAVIRAADRANRESIQRLEAALDPLLTAHRPQQLLAAAARRLTFTCGVPGC